MERNSGKQTLFTVPAELLFGKLYSLGHVSTLIKLINHSVDPLFKYPLQKNGN